MNKNKEKIGFSFFVGLFLCLFSSSVFAANEIVRIVSDGSRMILQLITNSDFFIVGIFLLLTLLFYFIFLIGINFLPTAKKKDDWFVSNKEGHATTHRKIALILAIISTIGLLGYAGYNGRSFSIGNIRNQVNNIMGLFGVITVWLIAFLVSGITYLIGNSILKRMASDGYHKGHPLEGRRKWGLLLLPIGLFVWIGNTLAGSYENSVAGLTLAFLGMMLMIWPSAEKESSP